MKNMHTVGRNWWKIVMISDGGVKCDFLPGFASETEANEAAEREGWCFVDENQFEWRLEVEENTSATIPF